MPTSYAEHFCWCCDAYQLHSKTPSVYLEPGDVVGTPSLVYTCSRCGHLDEELLLDEKE